MQPQIFLSVIGLVVEYIPATDETGVRFPDYAFYFFIILLFSLFSCLVLMFSFESGYGMKMKGMFFKNIGSILAYAVVGSIFCTLGEFSNFDKLFFS